MKEIKLIDLTCQVCQSEFKGEEPMRCCSSKECGCLGMPIDPIVCSEECYKKIGSIYDFRGTGEPF